MLNSKLSSEEDRLAALYKTRLLGTPAEERFDRITALAQKTFGVPVAMIDLVDKTRVWFKSVQGLPAIEGPRKDSYCQYTILRDEACIIPDAMLDQRLVDNPYASSLRFYAGVPIKIDGERIGTFCICDFEPRDLPDDHLRLLLDFAEMAEREINIVKLSEAQTAMAEENERLTQKSLVDTLTKCWNRDATLEALERELELAKEEKTPLGLMLLDVDFFKKVNDTYGHPAGDQVLAAVADRLRSVVRPYDVVGRFGGEEFLIVLSNCAQHALLSIAERVRDAVAAVPISCRGVDIPVTVSIGVTMALASGGARKAALIKAADLGLYTAKHSGRNRVESRWVSPSLLPR